MPVKVINIYLEPCRLLKVPLELQTRRPKTFRPRRNLKLLKTFFHISRRLEIGGKAWHELQQTPAINRSAAEQFKCLKINREDLFQMGSIICYYISEIVRALRLVNLAGRILRYGPAAKSKTVFFARSISR